MRSDISKMKTVSSRRVSRPAVKEEEDQDLENVEEALSDVSVHSDNEDDWVDRDEKKNDGGKVVLPRRKKLSPQLSNTVKDEYDYDSSDEEDIRNTVGNIPLQWYRNYDHIGYDWSGRRILKPKSADGRSLSRDLIDTFISRMNDSQNFARTVVDPQTGEEVTLTDDDLRLIQSIQGGEYPDLSYDPYEPWVDLYSHEVEQFPAIDVPPSKRSFTPSLAERVKIGRMVHSIKMGWMKPSGGKPFFATAQPKEQFYLMWHDGEEPEVNKYHRTRIPAPKLPLPTTNESYNPPAEYLWTPEEKAKWEKTDPEDRRQNFVPQKYGSLRRVPAFADFIKERFERCLDLYLCPRATKNKTRINDPEDLLPKLPKPRDLEPFPKLVSITYTGHTSLVRSISLDYSGQWLVSGCDDGSIRFWEVTTGRCMRTVQLSSDPIKQVAYNPNPQLTLVAAVTGTEIILVNAKLGDKVLVESTATLFSDITPSKPVIMSENNVDAKWKVPKSSHSCDGSVLLRLEHQKEISHINWHSKGDYFVVTMPQGQSQSIYVHQMSKRRTQNPFKKAKGLVGSAIFHPTRPQLFVISQQSIRIYDLLKQQLLRKLSANCKWISSAEIHPASGDHVLVGSYDCRLNWFDLNLSPRPYRMIRPHQAAIRRVCFHKRYPLFASCSDDGSILVSHATVEDDLLTNATIVPLRVLRNGHKVASDINNGMGILDCVFHPTQPWLFSSGADGNICLWT